VGTLLASSFVSVQAQTSATTLGEVRVTDVKGALAPSQVFTSVNIVPSERIEEQVTLYNWQLFEQVPGVQITPFGQGNTSGKFSLRGFNGEGEINAVKLLIDGVPSNSNDGNMPYIDLAPKLNIEAIEVVRGTNDPRYGLHNMAGSANIITKQGGNDRVVRLSAGSLGTQEAQAAIGIEEDGLSQNYALNHQKSQGHRAHSASENFGFSGKWFLASDDKKSRIGLIARRYEGQAQEAGYLTAEQAQADPTQSPAHNRSDEDKRTVTQLALQGEHRVSAHWVGSAQVYGNTIHDRRFVKFSASASQQERVVDEHHVGASAQMTWRAGQTALGDTTVVGGADLERQDNVSERYNTSTQVRTSQTRNQQFDFNTAGAFVQAMFKPNPQWTWVPAWRVDKVDGHYTNRLNGRVYPINAYGLVNQPKLSAIYQISDAASVYGNWGKTFQVGVGTASYKVNQVNDLAPSINEGWEAGVKFKPATWLDGRVSAWRQTASNEARRKLNDPANDAENIGKTQRQGVDFEINARPNQQTRLWASAAVQRSQILFAEAANTVGKEIDHVPRQLINLGGEHQTTQDLKLSAWINHQSDSYLERTNATGQLGGYTLLNASARYQVDRQLSVDVQARNLTNRYCEYVWWDGTQSLHAPAPKRSLFASATWRY
jgi:iron complex outermembrane receptor protein